MEKNVNARRNLLWIAVAGCMMLAACSDDNKEKPEPEPKPPVIEKTITLKQDKVVFTNEIREITVDSIVANVEMKKISAPDWVNVEIEKVKDQLYKAKLKMTADDYNNTLRSDSVIFGDGGQVKAKLQVDCEAAGELIVHTDTVAEKYPGDAGNLAFSVYGTENGYGILKYTMIIDKELGAVYTEVTGEEENPWFTVKETVTTALEALKKKDYQVEWQEYYIGDGNKERNAVIFVVPAGKIEDFDPYAAENVSKIEIIQLNAYQPPVKLAISETSFQPEGVKDLEFTVTLSKDFEDCEVYAWGMQINPEEIDSPLFGMHQSDPVNRAKWIHLERISQDGKVFTYKLSCDEMTEKYRGQNYRMCYLYALPKDADGKYGTYEIYDDWWGDWIKMVYYDEVSLRQELAEE